MKKLTVLLLGILSFGFSFGAYFPTTGDVQKITNLKNQLEISTQNDNQILINFYYQTKFLGSKYAFDQRISRMLSDLNSFLYNKLQTKKIIAKGSSKQLKSNFLANNISGINVSDFGSDNCTLRYNTMDNISFAYDFPTALTIATWYREANCGYYLPSNNRGPFQITSKNYGNGQINEEIFVQTIIDFIKFSKNKYANFENANSSSGLNINISYSDFDMIGLIRHSSLYNGLSGYTIYGEISPLNPRYARDNYGEYTGSTRDGVISKFLKILDWEMKNNY